MGHKKGTARRVTVSCVTEPEDKLQLTGPDSDGDVEVEIDVPNESVVSVTLNRASQQEALLFFGHALGLDRAALLAMLGQEG